MHLPKRISTFSPYVIWIVDVLLSTASTTAAILIAHAIRQIDIQDYVIYPLLIISFVASVLLVYVFRTYKGIISHAGTEEYTRVTYLVLSKGIILLAGIYLTQANHFIGWFLGGTVILDVVITSFILITWRLFLVGAYHHLILLSSKREMNALVYGTSEAAICVAIYLQNKNSDYQIHGFYSRRRELKDMRIQGFKTLQFDKDAVFIEYCQKNAINCVLFTNNKELHADEALVNLCLENGISIRIAPLMEANTQNVATMQVRSIQIEDLLGREEIAISMDKIGREIADKTILITGAAGSIGSELCRQLCKFRPKNLILVDMGETPTYQIDLELRNTYPEQNFTAVISDVRDYDRMDYQLTQFKPDIILHAAAYKHVPLMETYPTEAVRANILGTKNMADLAVKHGVQKFVMISTDKSVKPSNCMGATKHICEMYIQSLGQAIREGKVAGKTQFVTTRFGNVLGSNGSVIPLFRQQLMKGGPITITHPDIIRYFMTIPEASRLVLEAAFLGEGNDIFIFDMGEPVKIVDLAKRMIELTGLRPDKDIQIEYIGLRPGEKLYEELLYQKEATIPTTHPKIFRAQTMERDYDEINGQIQDLIATAITGNKEETVRRMKQIAPAFRSQNSQYAELDKKE